MPLPSLYLGGQSLDALGLRVTSLKGPWDIPAPTDPTLAIPGRAGLARTGGPTQIAPRTITIGASIHRVDAPRTNADLLAKIDTLKAYFAAGVLELVVANQITRGYLARLATFDVTMDGPAIAAISAQASITLTCTDPYGYDVNPSIIGFGATRVPIPLGTAPNGGILRIMGPATNPVISYRNIAGDVTHTIGLTRALLATDYEEIDLDLLKVTRVQSGAASNDIAALSSGDLESFTLSPEDGNLNAGQWPSLECSGLSAGGGCEILYTRRYL